MTYFWTGAAAALSAQAPDASVPVFSLLTSAQGVASPSVYRHKLAKIHITRHKKNLTLQPCL